MLDRGCGGGWRLRLRFGIGLDWTRVYTRGLAFGVGALVECVNPLLSRIEAVEVMSLLMSAEAYFDSFTSPSQIRTSSHHASPRPHCPAAHPTLEQRISSPHHHNFALLISLINTTPPPTPLALPTLRPPLQLHPPLPRVWICLC